MSATVTTEQVEVVVTEALTELVQNDVQVTRETTFEQLDADSLDLAEMSQIVDEKFGVRLRGDDVAGIETVGQLVDAIVAKAG